MYVCVCLCVDIGEVERRFEIDKGKSVNRNRYLSCFEFSLVFRYIEENRKFILILSSKIVRRYKFRKFNMIDRSNLLLLLLLTTTTIRTIHFLFRLQNVTRSVPGKISFCRKRSEMIHRKFHFTIRSSIKKRTIFKISHFCFLLS